MASGVEEVRDDLTQNEEDEDIEEIEMLVENTSAVRDKEQTEGESSKNNNVPGVSGLSPGFGNAETIDTLIWKRFQKLENGRAKCNLCHIDLATSNTTGMQRHFEKRHKKEFEAFDKEKNELMKTKKDKGKNRKLEDENANCGPKMKQLKFSFKIVDKDLQRRWDNALVEYAADSFSTFRQLGSPKFKELIAVANKLIKVKSSGTLSNHVKNRAIDILKQIVALLKAEKPHIVSVAFTTDLWTDRPGDAFVSLTLHYIDRDWKLQRFTPFVKHFEGAHSGLRIKIVLDDMIEALTLNEEEIKKYCVNDNAKNQKKAIRESQYLKQYLYDNHTLQLAVGDTFKSTNVSEVKMSVVLHKCKDLGRLTHQSTRFTKIANANETRWNSNLATMESVLRLKPALDLLFDEDDDDFSSKRFTVQEWKLIKGAVDVLKLVLIVTKAWETEAKPTMNCVVEELFTLNKKLEQFIRNPSNCKYAIGFAATLLKNIEKRFPNGGTLVEERCVGNYVDPAWKGAHLIHYKSLEQTKRMMEARWGEIATEKEDEEEERARPMSPTTKLLMDLGEMVEVGRENESDLKKEMLRYEALPRMDQSGDRLDWWKNQEKNLPKLARIAKEILVIPAASSKSERVFSIGSQIVTPKRCRLSPSKVESLMIIKDNSKRLEEVKKEEGPNPFDKIKTFVEVMDIESDDETGSAVFNESEDGMDDFEESDEEDDNDVSDSDQLE